MSFLKNRSFQVKFTLKSFQAQCKRTSCKVSAFIKIDQQQRSFKDVVDMKKNIAHFNTQLQWQVLSFQYDEVSKAYPQKMAIISINYQTIEVGGRLNKIKVGHVNINLAKLLNSNSYRIQAYYPVQKCYDKQAKVKLAVDFNQIQKQQKLIQMNSFKTQGNFKHSKIKERIIQDQRNILQQKVYQYQDRLQKYRDTHGHQVKKLQQNIQKKQQRIQQIISQNNSLVTSLQSHQLNIEKYKNRMEIANKENQQLKDQLRTAINYKQKLQQQIGQVEREMKNLGDKLDQQQKAKQTKQRYFKLQIQKYNNKYIQSENNRNRIIFELQTKLKSQLQKKDIYYQQIIKGLESKKYENSHTSKQIIRKRQIQISQLTDTIEGVHRQKQKYIKQIQFLNNQLIMKKQNNQALLKQIQTCKKSINSYIYQLQQAHFSNQTLQKSVQQLKSTKISLRKQLQQIKYQLQLAKGTIQNNSNKIAKYTKQLQIFKQRQYYIQQKFQNQLQQKSYNQQCMIQTNQNFKTKISKLTMECKLLKQMVDDLQQVVQQLQKDKKCLQDKLYRQHNAKFQQQQQIIGLQNQIMRQKKTIQNMQNNVSKSFTNFKTYTTTSNNKDQGNLYSYNSRQSYATFHPKLYKFQQT